MELGTEKLRIEKPGIIPVSLWNSLVDMVASCRIVSVDGGSYERSKGGTKLRVGGGPGGAAAAADHPFKVLVRNNGTAETPDWEAKVTLESWLYKSLRPNDKQTVTLVDTWFPLLGNDAIWLGIVFDSLGAITYVGIDSWGQNKVFEIDELAWSGNDGYCEDDGGTPPVHQTSRKLIAYSVADDDGNPVLTQVMFRDQVLRDVNIDGRPARYPFDHEGGYPV